MTNKDELKRKLDPMAYAVTQEGATEPPFTGKFYDTHDRGMYRCVVCGTELFSSDTKFESGTGWPSFTNPANREQVELVPDRSHGTVRTEVKCKTCGAHLGHVFDDGPADKGGKRYCINSCALDFESKPE
ncbi:peptide-methionine (R)-S-oxide reductase MsrB [Candidatus Berkelbacteria bacterium]|nr:peptide-methionine (R)-S-oxide reductase MsrB [Candidatus Berkelbacteria bacterium]